MAYYLSLKKNQKYLEDILNYDFMGISDSKNLVIWFNFGVTSCQGVEYGIKEGSKTCVKTLKAFRLMFYQKMGSLLQLSCSQRFNVSMFS